MSDTTSEDRTGELVYFLIVYDTGSEDILSMTEYDRGSEAEAAYFAAEREHHDDQVQVVLFGAESIDSVRATHPHYFRDSGGDTIEFLAPAPAPVPSR